MRRALELLVFFFVFMLNGCGDDLSGPLCDPGQSWIEDRGVLVKGVGETNRDCRTGLCPHNENTDLIRWRGDLWLVHRSAMSQVLGPNSALHFYRSRDEGKTFERMALLPALHDRDIRDPIFYIVGDQLYVKVITRLPGFKERDLDADSISLVLRSSNGVDWTEMGAMGPATWGHWRVTEHDGVFYSAAYQDGDLAVDLYASSDGVSWQRRSTIFTDPGVLDPQKPRDTPLETEIVFTPAGKLLALVRLDGTDAELRGGEGRLRTKVCWADAPFEKWDCRHEIGGARLDGHVHFWHDGRLFLVARKHLQPSLRKRTAVYELTGDFAGGALEAVEWGYLPSAGDTSYAGVVRLADGRYLVSWYSSEVAADPSWPTGFLGPADIRTAVLDLDRLPRSPHADCAEQPDLSAPPVSEDMPTSCNVDFAGTPVACGNPCDSGNEKGHGRYCTIGGEQCKDNGEATDCAAGLAALIGVELRFCTRLCNPTLNDCGSATTCRCIEAQGTQLCGCIPDTCNPPGLDR